MYYYRVSHGLLTRRYSSVRQALKHAGNVRASLVRLDPFSPVWLLDELEGDEDALKKHVEQIANAEAPIPLSEIDWGYIS